MTCSNVSLAVQRAKLLKAVPPFRPVAVKLLNLVSDISQPLSRIVNLLRADAVLTAEVLRLANSPLLGCRNEIKSMLVRQQNRQARWTSYRDINLFPAWVLKYAAGAAASHEAAARRDASHTH
jgi:hypothetical protein